MAIKKYQVGTWGIPYRMTISYRKYTEWTRGSYFKVAGGLAGFGTQNMKTVKIKVEMPLLNSPYSYKVPGVMVRLGYEDKGFKYGKDGHSYYVYVLEVHLKFWGEVPTKDEKLAVKEMYEGRLQGALGHLYREWREVEKDPAYVYAEI